jgi:hypothetical protein
MNLRRVLPAAFAAFAAVAVLAVQACGTGTEPVSEARPARSSEPVSASPSPTSDAAPAPKSAATIDACGLLSAEMTDVLGRHDGGTPGTSSILTMCTWVNEDSADRATLIVGSPGTAPGGKLVADPSNPTAPGPDGLVFGKHTDDARFAAGDRMCSIQVLTDLDDEQLRSTLVRLAGLVRDRV